MLQRPALMVARFASAPLAFARRRQFCDAVEHANQGDAMRSPTTNPRLTANGEFGSMVKSTSQRRRMAHAFLDWLHNGDTESLVAIGRGHGFAVSRKDPFLTWSKEGTVTFHLAILQDASDTAELIGLLSNARTSDHLPLLIIQYSNVHDGRGANVFDVFGTSADFAIYHTNRVYTERT
jgi:hypothetical protein